ncbi:M23 family metallopeptidase [Streptomyces sp. S.PB5]|uniref:M23 family metallopeptidase n=1 Tax=Streptomyces sp. S.PB5 TaxID=3020844 RepID=UPI0025B07464|nr:M23 family metallopeptidase [Streptomyces sp. S.PB5]MDN3024539.1 M23 family metallopeptidase [Streptomyces sp. S.PB5]
MTTPAPASDASAHYASYGAQEAQYGDHTAYGYDTGAHTTTHFDTDPLFGSLPGDSTGSYDTGHWSTGSQQTLNYDAYAAQHHAAYDTGAYDTTGWTGEHQQLSAIPPQAGAADASGWGSPLGGSDAGAWLQPDQSGNAADQTQHWEWGTQAFDTGAYDATQWNSDGGTAATQLHEEPVDHQSTAMFEQLSYEEPAGHDTELSATGELPALAEDDVDPLLDGQEDATPAPAPGSRMATRNANRSRRRTPAKRSALMKIAVPSACVMGVTGIAAASVGGLSDDKDTSTTASDATTKSVKPSAANNKLDTQLESLSAGADDFGDRVSRTQERIDLKAQQEAEKKKAAEEAARKERLRPKFALPVAQRGLSAYYGQAGINWMSVHTGIDFPVSYGTTVMAATDGVVRTQWNSAYGNMMIVTAKDGTETWYCHLSSYRVASGTTVKAGDPIAYSGNSGNSTGPHLHFEVRPGGGSAIDPLPWLRSHGLDPT